MPIDSFSGFVDSPIAPASRCFSIVPSDETELAVVTKALYVGSGGDVVLRAVDAVADVAFRNVSAGSTLDVRVRAVRAAGTTAADIVGLA